MPAPLPLYRPMLAVSASPEEIPSRWAGQEWIEVKWDGYRCLAYIDQGTATLRSRGLKDLSPWFPELRRLPAQVKAARAILDGELVIFADGRPSFSHLQARVGGLPRVHARGAPDDKAPLARSPVTFIVFDALHIGEAPLIHLPLRERYRRLVDSVVTGGPLQLSEPLPATGKPTPIARALAAVRDRGLEGIVAKDPASPYLPGERSPFWRKVKVRREILVRIVGFTARGEYVKALLAATVDPPFAYLGRIGTGFTEGQRRTLYYQLRPFQRPRAPLAEVPPDVPEDACWVRPDMICRVNYLEISPQGRLRHPSFAGWIET